MNFNDALYNKVTDKIDRANAPENVKVVLHALLDSAYMKARPMQYVEKKYGKEMVVNGSHN